jgi:hypothetical protein
VNVREVVVGLAWVAATIAVAASCSSSTRVVLCTPGASVACTGPGGCTGGQVCSSDGAGYGGCLCGSADSGSGSSSGASAATGCAPCWTHWACLENGSTLVYFDGSQNSDGTCALTAENPGISDVTLECVGQTNQTPWTEPLDGTVDFDEPAGTLSCNET